MLTKVAMRRATSFSLCGAFGKHRAVSYFLPKKIFFPPFDSQHPSVERAVIARDCGVWMCLNMKLSKAITED